MTPAHPLRPFAGRVVFDHLPKTAGQAVNAWLVEALGSASVTPNLSGNHGESLRRHGGIYTVLSGHMTFDGEGLDPRWQYVSMLREPMDRAASWTYYLLGDVPELTSTRALIHGARRFVDSGGRESTPEFLDTLANPYIRHFARVAGARDEPPARQLEVALQVVRDYAWVGIYEEMDGFLAGFAGLLGVEAPASLARVNVSRGRARGEALPPEARARAAALNEHDLAFYAQVAAWVRGPAGASRWPRRAAPQESRWSRLERDDRLVVATPELVIVSTGVPRGDEVVRGDLFEFEVVMDIPGGDHAFVLGIDVRDEEERLVHATNTELLGHGDLRLAPGRHAVRFCVAAEWPLGRFTLGFTAQRRVDGVEVPAARHPDLCRFRVLDDGRSPGPGHSPAPTVVCVERVA